MLEKQKYLKNLITSDKIHHAYLLLHESMEFLRQTSFEFVAQTVQIQTGQDKDILLKRIEDGFFQDLLVIERDIKKQKKENIEYKDSIGIDQVKTIASFIKMQPLESKYRFVIVTNCDMLTDQAQNALLKTIEEPQGSAVILLLGIDRNSLLPTVLSRVDEISLIEESSYENKLSDNEQEWLLSYIENILLQGELGDIFILSEKMKNEKEKALQFIEFLYHYFLTSNLPQSDIDEFRDHMILSDEFRKHGVDGMLKTIYNASKDIKQNASVQLTVEAMLISIQEEMNAEISWS